MIKESNLEWRAKKAIVFLEERDGLIVTHTPNKFYRIQSGKETTDWFIIDNEELMYTYEKAKQSSDAAMSKIQAFFLGQKLRADV